MRSLVLGMALVVGMSVTPTFAAQGTDRTRLAQQELKNKGYSPGPIDGIDGPKTEAAISAYQKDKHLAVDGRLNAEVMDSLGLHGRTSGGQFSNAGSKLTNGYGKGGSQIGDGGKKLGKDVKTGEYANAPVDFGKDFGKGVAKMGKATGSAAKHVYKGAKDAVTPK